ncbi:triphosphoribosyl-dephospho-CoA synthase [Variovorax sp. J22R133]|uniref:triphosphoribosyl-dephospho-CoA synthase n=1 Tax=Variovorax brevis TaxID=3053503 RepID=UPI002576E500|nr:triphosphoribosyl-dephospho-CoA synthase [Variovorax sp. J22R133]MDM0115956.1 triphosphoribosyl-dephospho-CoA synthase [Variovorax sp. J22R133]
MPVTAAIHPATVRAKACFLRACELDVAVRKPGNVSRASPGHRMEADMFVASAQAAADPLLEPGARVGARIEAAVEASWAAAGCNTNLGIVLLCAPVARAVDQQPDACTPTALRASVEAVLADLDVADAQAAYRAIARANPGGLGTAPREDVSQVPTVDLRTAMRLAAHRDSIARQYRNGYADLFNKGLPALGTGFSLMGPPANAIGDLGMVAAVQRLYLTLLAGVADSHIVRIHGEAVAHTVMSAAQAWQSRASAGAALDGNPDFEAWDASLKAGGINPGTTADLTVATLLISGLATQA